MMQNSIQLQTDSILQVPLQKYLQDFTFIVNSEIYKTSSIVADLLSPVICSRHLTDPTFKEFTIETKERGNFNKILNLINFEQHEILDEDLSFVLAIIEKLGTEKILINHNSCESIANNNIFELIEKHQHYPHFYKADLEKEIEYFSSHFYELKDKLIETIKNDTYNIDSGILTSIINHKKLVLNSEDDLLDVVNELYRKNKQYSTFYEYIEFVNVSQNMIKEFISTFDIDHLTRTTWSSICCRLEQQLSNITYKSSKYKKYTGIDIQNKPNTFDGILNYLQTHHNIKDEISITYSSNEYSYQSPFELLKYNDKNTYFSTKSEENSWICFEFKNHKIIPSDYIIRSYHTSNNWHLKSWNFEGSNDKNQWAILDQQKDNSSLNGANKVFSFHISNNHQSFKYLRIRLTGPNWYNTNNLFINSIEFYGLIV